MQLKQISAVTICALMLSACGGGGGSASDATAPTISGVSVSAPSNGQVTLTATASDATGVTGYCFKTDATAPAASDACFTAAATKLIGANSLSTPHYLWAKDAANNISTAFSVDLTAPTVSGVSVSAPTNGQVTLTATASDATGVTGYCFKTDATAPAASDACFTTAATKLIATPSTTSHYYLWAKDAAGNLSLAFDKTLTDGVAPTISGVSVSAPSNGQVTLTATASDATGVTGYCFKTDATAPTSTDNCFQVGATTTVNIPQSASQYVWARDAAGNISTRASAGCSATGVTASQISALPTVCVSTSLGEFVLALESTKAPLTTANFLKYVNDGFYSQTVFHRVISNFMIQGGGFTGVPISLANTKAGTVYEAIELETTTKTGLSNTTGTIAMARQTALNTATNQFFINVVDNSFLNTSGGGYAAFGHVISGLDTAVQSIRGLPVQSNGSEISQPLNPPVINWAYQLK